MKTHLAFVVALMSSGALVASAAPQPGDNAPDFSLTDIHGQKHSLADYKGKYVVLEWNNPGCPFVKAQYDTGSMPKLQEQERAKGVVWLTINSAAGGQQGDLPPEQIESFLKSKHADPTAYLKDPDGTVGHLYGARTTPDMYVISPEGKLIYDGAIDNANPPEPDNIPGPTNYVKAALDESMAGKPVTVAVSRPYGCSVKY